MSTPITSALVVCVAAAGLAAGALFLEADDDNSSPPGTAPAPAADGSTGGNGGYGGGAGGETPAPAGASLEISGFQFGSVAVDGGGQVDVQNRDSAPHTVTADDGGFDTGVDGGSSGSFTAPAQPGTYSFHCEIHPDMSGSLTVR